MLPSATPAPSSYGAPPPSQYSNPNSYNRAPLPPSQPPPPQGYGNYQGQQAPPPQQRPPPQNVYGAAPVAPPQTLPQVAPDQAAVSYSLTLYTLVDL